MNRIMKTKMDNIISDSFIEQPVKKTVMLKLTAGGKLFIVLLVVLIAGSTIAQFNVNWIRYYEGPGMAYDNGNVVKTDANGFIYVGGLIRTNSSIGSEDFCLIKYEPNGQIVWQRSYNGPAGYTDHINDMVLDGAGNIYVTGQSFGINCLYDFCTIKYDNNGNLLWVNRYDNAGNDEALKILKDDSGNIYSAGVSDNNLGVFDICLIKYASDGTEEWVRRFDGSGIDLFSAMAQDIDGSIYLVGSTFNGSNKYDICLLKYSPDGNLIFAEKYDRGFQLYDVAHAITLSSTGDIYIAGRSKNSGGDYDCALIKYTSDGNLLWDRFYNGTGNDYDQASSVCTDNSGNVIITGWSWGSSTSDDFITIKYNSSGDMLWEKRYDNNQNGTPSSDGGEKVMSDNEGNLFVMGVSNTDYFLICYSTAGNINYEYRYDGAANGLEEPADMCFDKNNSIIITGLSEHYVEDVDICTIKIQNLVTGVNVRNRNIPAQFSLGQNYPNPFNPKTKITFSIAESGQVKLAVYDITGKQAAEIVNERYNAGTYEVDFDASKLSSGVYLYRITANNYTETRKMILTK